MERYLFNFGVKEGTFSVADVYGLDDDLLAMVPLTAVAVLMLFPLTEKLEKAIQERDNAVVRSGLPPSPGTLFFMEQLVGNACGTIGLLHSVINNNKAPSDATNQQPRIGVRDGSFISKFMSKIEHQTTTVLNPLSIGKLLESADELDGLHGLAAESGQSGLPDEEMGDDHPYNRIYHFIAFVARDGYLWELDGRRSYPHRVGPCGGSSGMPLLKAASEAIQWYMEQDSDNIQFGLTALVANSADTDEEM